MKTHFYYIDKQEIKKRNSIQINLPTFNSYEVTKNTIKKLFKQKGIKFDILLIDNGTEDYKKLIKDFPEINYVVLKENTGSSGAQRIGAELALKNKYEYIIFTDNDAILLDDFGLLKMKQKLDSFPGLVAVVPSHTESFGVGFHKDFYIRSWSFHYLFVKSEVFKKTDLHNFYLFLYSDDLSLTLKLSSVGKVLVCGNVKYYHYGFNPKSLLNFYNYFYLRGLLYITFKEKNIKFSSRIMTIFNFFYKVFQTVLYSIFLLDFSYIKTIFLAIMGFMDIRKNLAHLIPVNKYKWEEINGAEINKKVGEYIDVSQKRLKLFLPLRRILIRSNYLNRNIYFELVKSR